MMCPICNKESTPDFTPFCSKGCKSIDLMRWLKEGYRIPGASVQIEKADDDGEE